MAALIGSMVEYNHATDDWQIYQEKLDQYFAANKITEEPVKTATLVSLIGTSTYTILRELTYPALPKDQRYAELTKLLSGHFSPIVSVWRERSKFWAATQMSGKTSQE